MNRHSTGITLALTVALALGLSIAPLPDALRPLPRFKDDPVETVVAAVLPRRTAPLKKQDAITGAPQVAVAAAGEGPLPAEEDPPLPQAAKQALLPGAPLPPEATLGAAASREVRRLERWVKRVGATHVDVEQACLEEAEGGECRRWSLDAFFEKVEALQRGEAKAPVRVVHLGDSQIASDHITDLVRRRLQLRYGSGGPGFLFVDRPTRNAGRKVRTGEASEGWEIVKLTDRTRDGLLGYSGVRFVSRASPQKTRFAARNAKVAELFFVTSPKGGTVDVMADGAKVSHVLTRFMEPELAFSRITLPGDTKTLSLAAGSGEVNLLGVSLETGAPGIVYDSVGLPGALFEVYLRAKESVFAAQLARREPALVVLMLGGNEAYEIGRGWQTLEDARKSARALVDRVQKAAPGASCLLMAPLDAGIRTVGGEIEPRPHTAEVGKVIREVAMEKGCAFWDLLRAMGGIGSVPRWLGLGLWNQDLIHPRGKGADILGHLFDFALERARTRREGARNLRFADAPGLHLPSPTALGRTARALEALKEEEGREKVESLRVVQLGASHTASHLFTDEVRRELARRYGGAGRGYVAAGRPSDRLLPGVRRELRGTWAIPDAREPGPDRVFGLTGIRALAQPGAALRIAFKPERHAASDAPAQVQVHYLESPRMGRLEVRIDGEVVAELGPLHAAQPGGSGPLGAPVPGAAPRAQTKGRAPPPRDDHPRAALPPKAPPAAGAPGGQAGRVKVARFEVRGTAHEVEVRNLGPGIATLFGVALDAPRGGVVWDALGLPGSTAILADGFDRPALEAQLRARAADLYVLFYGTNEAALPDFDPAALRAHYRSLLATLRRASPDAGCLILGPTDRLEQAGGSWSPAPHLEETLEVLRALSREEGCAFWSARAAMGGPGSMARWQSVHPPLANGDGIHLTKDGYRALARALVDDLLASVR